MKKQIKKRGAAFVAKPGEGIKVVADGAAARPTTWRGNSSRSGRTNSNFSRSDTPGNQPTNQQRRN